MPAAAASALVAAAGLGLLLVRPEGAGPRQALPVAAPVAAPVPVAGASGAAPAVAPGPVPVWGDRAAILDHRAPVPVLFRDRDAPRVFVLDFPDLDLQGAALNRLAALVEKAGLPRDRLLTDAELARAIAAAGDTAATYYYGHNYRLSDVERLFVLARRDGIALNGAEAWLADVARAIREAVPDGNAALVTLTTDERAGDRAARAAILRHELSHGRFFTEPAFAQGVMQAWAQGFTEAERQRFRSWLAAGGYDPANEKLMANEMQAYLLHTDDPRFFRPELVGLSAAEAERLRRLVLARIAEAVASEARRGR